jgi:hypothetical protein
LAHGDHGLDGASGAAGEDGIRRFAKLLQLGQFPVNARVGCQGSGHGVKKEIAGSPFSLFSFAYLAYFAVSSGALGSSLPAATGGGFGLAPWENPGPRPPKAGAALSPTGQGKFRRDEQGCPKFVAAPHGLAPWSIAGYSRKFVCGRYSTGRADGAFAQVKRPDSFICRRFRFIQNVICLIHIFSIS